jgi:hypothetical protein
VVRCRTEARWERIGAIAVAVEDVRSREALFGAKPELNATVPIDGPAAVGIAGAEDDIRRDVSRALAKKMRANARPAFLKPFFVTAVAVNASMFWFLKGSAALRSVVFRSPPDRGLLTTGAECVIRQYSVGQLGLTPRGVRVLE